MTASSAPFAVQIVSGSTLPPALHVVCTSTIRSAYNREFPRHWSLRLSIARDGPYALVSWIAGEAGGMSVFRRRGAAWCRTASGSGAFSESDLVGFDGIDRARAHRLFNRLPTTSIAHAR